MVGVVDRVFDKGRNAARVFQVGNVRVPANGGGSVDDDEGVLVLGIVGAGTDGRAHNRRNEQGDTKQPDHNQSR